MVDVLNMELLHTHGIKLIQDLQFRFKDYSGAMLFATKLGDPRAAFLIYFPIAYVLQPSVGIKVAWVGAISEMLNTVFKWFLYGHRPYWWVHESGVYNRSNTPYLDQYLLTCETGPGSPSGHCMVTAAVFIVMISAFIKSDMVLSSQYRRMVPVVCWTGFSLFMAAVCVSRCFIATHFPHQVIAGVFAGSLVGYLCNKLINPSWTLEYYILGAASMLLSGLSLFTLMQNIGFDPVWSVSLAKKWCAHPEWIHLDTTLFFALVKDSSTLIGLGLGLSHFGSCESKSEDIEYNLRTVSNRIVTIILALFICQFSDSLKLPTHSQILFYVISFIKHALTIYFVVCLDANPFKSKVQGVENISTKEKIQ